jgi:hypothetical protein
MYKLRDWIDPTRLDSYNLSQNPAPAAVEWLQEHPKYIDWHGLSRNPHAMHILKRHPDRIDWYHMSVNPAALDLLEQHPDKIDLYMLSENPGVMPQPKKHGVNLVEMNPEKIVDWNQDQWEALSKHPDIFVYDYDAMRTTKAPLHEELVRVLFHPDNLHMFDGWGVWLRLRLTPCPPLPLSPPLFFGCKYRQV